MMIYIKKGGEFCTCKKRKGNWGDKDDDDDKIEQEKRWMI